MDKSKDHIPTYKEITASKPGSDPAFPSIDDSGNEYEANISDSSFDSLNDAFETSYNFRFEEPDGSVIPSFPRSIPTLVRREDSRRKDAREKRRQRKEGEMEKKREEVKRLKTLKMKEIRRKLDMIGREGGLLDSNLKGKGKAITRGDKVEGGKIRDALKEFDLEGDWDPEKHDQQMANLYDGVEDEEDVGEIDEDGKPIWEDDIDIGPVVNKKDEKKKKKRKKRGGEDEEDLGVDVDAMDVLIHKTELSAGEEWDGTEEMRKRKFDEYMEEIYNYEFNDMVCVTWKKRSLQY